MLELDFGDMPEKLKEEYVDKNDGIQSEILNTTRFGENSDLSTTYLGGVDTTRASKIKVEETFPISQPGYVHCRKTTGWNRMSNTIGYRS